jgi:hypothetical protein
VISRAYLNRLARHLKFESILKYVALPRLNIELPASEDKERTDEENEDGEAEDMEK